MYIAFSNNPIIKIDPRGDDDFFDKQGSLIYSTKVGSNIRIITSSIESFKNAVIIGTPIITAELKGSSAGKAMNHFLESYSAPLSSTNFNYKNNSNYNMAYYIGQYYYNLAGFTEKDAVGGAVYEGDAIGVTTERMKGLPISENNNAIYMAVNPGYDKISSILDDKFNLMNLWVHERSHWLGKSIWPAFASSAVESENHLNAYYAQITHYSTWTNTTTAWQELHIHKIGEKLYSLSGDKRTELQEKFEKQLGIKFTKIELNTNGKVGDAAYNIQYEKTEK